MIKLGVDGLIVGISRLHNEIIVQDHASYVRGW
jgi:hypothetical protein